jgi:tetratricopeptide (TPR) repeat protein
MRYFKQSKSAMEEIKRIQRACRDRSNAEDNIFVLNAVCGVFLDRDVSLTVFNREVYEEFLKDPINSSSVVKNISINASSKSKKDLAFSVFELLELLHDFTCPFTDEQRIIEKKAFEIKNANIAFLYYFVAKEYDEDEKTLLFKIIDEMCAVTVNNNQGYADSGFRIYEEFIQNPLNFDLINCYIEGTNSNISEKVFKGIGCIRKALYNLCDIADKYLPKKKDKVKKTFDKDINECCNSQLKMILLAHKIHNEKKNDDDLENDHESIFHFVHTSILHALDPSSDELFQLQSEVQPIYTALINDKDIKRLYAKIQELRKVKSQDSIYLVTMIFLKIIKKFFKIVEKMLQDGSIVHDNQTDCNRKVFSEKNDHSDVVALLAKYRDLKSKGEFKELLAILDKADEISIEGKDKVYIWREKGENFFKNKNYEMTLKCCNNIISSYASQADPSVFCLLASTYLKQMDLKNAIKAYNNAIHIFKNDKTILALMEYQKGCAYYSHKHYGESIECFTKSIELNVEFPQFLDALEKKGSALFEIQLYDEAANIYIEAIKLNRESYENWFHLGETYSILKNFDRALYCFQQGILKNPNNAKIWFSMGKVYEELNDLSKASTCFKKAKETSG